MEDIIINCDLGENESAERSERLMALVGAANICCGVHAGSAAKTRATLALAKRYGVQVGAHPGLAAAGGRGADLPSAVAFAELLETQVGGFLQLAKEEGVRVGYVKLHGSLYHAVEKEPMLAAKMIEYIQSLDIELGLFSLAGGVVAKDARASGLKVWEELFADRGYLADGSLIPRGSRGALIEKVDVAAARLAEWRASGKMATTGASIVLNGQTVCVHSDSPNSLELLEELRKRLSSASK